MIPDPKNPKPDTSSIIIDILSKTPRLTVKELFSKCIVQSNRQMTLQGFYRLLSQLQGKRVIVKDGKLLSIDAGWVHAVIDFSNQLRTTYLQTNPSTANILVGEGECSEFEFHTVIDMDNFWYHALVIVMHYYVEHSHADKNVYNYNDRCWFQVIRSGSEQALGDMYADMGAEWYLVAGSDSFIDSLVENMIDTKKLHYKISHDRMFDRNYYIVVIGDYIFETRLPKYIYDMMETVYERVTAITDPTLQSLEEFIRLPGKTKLNVSRNERRALALRKKIQTCFAV